MPSYFFVAVSSKEYLELCIRYALAGFTNNINGAWAYCDIKEGDYISFLYGARAYNLYRVESKKAIRNAVDIPPWKPLKFKESGKSYFFPFRLALTPVRKFVEPLARPEFSYIAENLLLRGGYRKTHFQGDRTTLQNVSQMGELYKMELDKLDITYDLFTPNFIRSKNINPPELLPFKEIILQSILREYLSNMDNLSDFFEMTGLGHLNPGDFEVLGEKALPEGHLDLLIKDLEPIGKSRSIIVEVKLNKSNRSDVEQLKRYMKSLGEECIAGVIISDGVSRNAYDPDLHFIKY